MQNSPFLPVSSFLKATLKKNDDNDDDDGDDE